MRAVKRRKEEGGGEGKGGEKKEATLTRSREDGKNGIDIADWTGAGVEGAVLVKTSNIIMRRKGAEQTEQSECTHTDIALYVCRTHVNQYIHVPSTYVCSSSRPFLSSPLLSLLLE
mmetsp:Transcript_19568/g.50154  ORF Transcript_19568/g.50154 Transcript_19568/m.50154 type:complete len:116 (-) Transcript_19568:92-439(-)